MSLKASVEIPVTQLDSLDATAPHLLQSLEEYEEQLPAINGDFTGKDIVAVSQFTREDVDIVMAETTKALAIERSGDFVHNLRGLKIGRLFFEDSTRTDQSYRFAAGAGGAFIDGFNGTNGLSAGKGEPDIDTLETMDQYADLLVVRHPQAEFVPWAALNTKHPVHNAGNGAWEHPTQAMLDLATIQQLRGRVEGETVTMYGDLRMGRTVHSLAQVLAMYPGVRVNLVAPEQLQMPSHVLKRLQMADICQTDDINEVIGGTDVLYRVRFQKNRYSEEDSAVLAPKVAMVTSQLLSRGKDDMVVLHPRPEDAFNPDFGPDVRKDKRYGVVFQTHMGLVVRRALLGLTAGRSLTA